MKEKLCPRSTNKVSIQWKDLQESKLPFGNGITEQVTTGCVIV